MSTWKTCFPQFFLLFWPLSVHRTEADVIETTQDRTTTLEGRSVIVPDCPPPSGLHHRAVLRCLGHKQLLPALRLLKSGLSLACAQLTKELPQLQLRQILKWNWLEVQYVPPLFSCHGRGWTGWTSGHAYQYNCSSLLAKPAHRSAIAAFQNGLIWIPEAKHRSDSPCHGPGLTADTNVTRETQFSIIRGSCYSH